MGDGAGAAAVGVDLPGADERGGCDGERAGDRLIRIIANAGNDRDYRPPSAPSEEQKRLLKSMQAMVARCADDLGLSAEIIAPRKELTAVSLHGKTDSRVFTGWRRELVGERLLALL